MGHTLYLDCSSGIAGDMLVAALLDLGANELGLRAMLANLTNYGLEDFDIKIGRVSKNGIDACDFDVILAGDLDTHDHDMAWLHPTSKDLEELEAEALHAREHLRTHRHEDEHTHTHEPEHRHNVEHTHEHDHEHEHDQTHHHAHRHLADVLTIIERADISRRAREIAQKTFEILAEAEAKAHGATPEEVHFHEVGAVDSIVDVLAAAFCLDNLDIDEVIVGNLSEGTGTIRCAHGLMPIPVPAVSNICTAHNIALNITPIHGELVTPTGAALVAAIRTATTPSAPLSIAAIGIGAGKRTYACPGIVRAMLLRDNTSATSSAYPSTYQSATSTAHENTLVQKTQSIVKLECDIDDSTGEALGITLDYLFQAGAREAHYLPLVTKKNRPAWQLQVICTEELKPVLEEIIFENTTTIGIRSQKMQRTVLERQAQTLETDLGPVQVKCVTLPSQKKRFYPEHEDVVRFAQEHSLSYQAALQLAMSVCAQASA